MPTVFIAGANRGIGLEFARQYALNGFRVIAGCRNPDAADELQKLSRQLDIRVCQLDTTSDNSVAATLAAIGAEPLDLMICSAAVPGGKRQDWNDMDLADLATTLDVNVSGPLRLAAAFASNLANAQSAKLIAITSQMGSIEETTTTQMMFYRISKTALNEAWRCLAIELKPKGITAMVLHPGWVATAMGGPEAPLTPSESVAGMRKVIDALSMADSGTFRAYDGKVIPW